MSKISHVESAILAGPCGCRVLRGGDIDRDLSDQNDPSLRTWRTSYRQTARKRRESSSCGSEGTVGKLAQSPVCFHAKMISLLLEITFLY